MGHRNRAPVEDLKSLGAREAETPRELAGDVRHRAPVRHRLAAGRSVSARARRHAAAADKPGLIVIDCSTSNPVSTLALGEALAQRGMTLVDAPLGRTPAEAEAGTLDTMVGADAATFATILPVLQCWAANINHLGPLGLGHKMKLINNFIAMGYAALYAEALAISRRAGLSIEQFHAVIGSGRMRCGFYDTFMKWTLERDPNAHRFSIANAHKDMRYLASMANEAGAVNTLQAGVKNSFAAMEAAGQGDRYVPMLADFIAGLNGLPSAAEAK